MTVTIKIGNAHKIDDSIETMRKLNSKPGVSGHEGQILCDVIGILVGIKEVADKKRGMR